MQSYIFNLKEEDKIEFKDEAIDNKVSEFLVDYHFRKK